MKITLKDIGRRYNNEWIFRHINYTFESGKSYAILGHNGSGKSTFLKVLSSSLTPSAGELIYTYGEEVLSVDQIYQQLSLAAPYVELIEEFTLNELIDFHFKFKNYLPSFDKETVVSLLGLEHALDREIRFFSSGMRQRVKLALACCSASSLVLLDEPTSNLDSAGEEWYLNLIDRAKLKSRILVVCSNQKKEYEFCDETISILDFKA
ncbi:ABC transporter ATP-binding protein [Sphingobacterium paramultivorum]|uniref:ABC transporter ATP-binding protein n=1 Tax=Sphingobacterium paramultivorum TaxID=2886510 RepID=A0A7G5E6H8_9SPHI|nr:ATP-binding cassette domain-containing protein [Sphingobacterium sp.]MBB1646168.1 ABC transporter ATP-binding protein [Sphingobacterium sp. UME9]QMV69603.1 ABC transporter ATP-binding protein [Sphingobacterium paramultivorum]WET70626.1 MAG: ATP-binding cassette domain-containing protein [Sphingobacterium sp.]